MKKTNSYLTRSTWAVLALLTAACSSDDNATQALRVQVKVTMPGEFVATAVYAGHEVSLGKYTATTDDAGIATFEGVIPDVYDISTSCEITAEEYRQMTGNDSQNENYVISGSLLNQTIASEGLITLPTNVAVKQSLVISKVYYSGTKDNNGKNYLAGKYVEFFNNSEQPVDIAGLYFGLVESESSPAYTLGTTPDYLYLKQIYRFPADRSFVVEAGGSVVAANSAIDHTANNEVDLSGADFEAKYEGTGGFTNNPDVPALEVIYSYITNTSMNLVQGGPCSVVLFATDDDPANWERVYKQGASSGNLYVKMPIRYVMDGVECLKNKATSGPDITTKRLYDYIDAGYQFTEATTGYTAEVVYRRSLTSDNGRTLLADTNNSSNDFAIARDINPREYR